jgi:hypothetical protein
METKICTKCGKEKNIDEFKIVKGTERRKAQCRQCDNEYNKLYRIKNKEKEYLRKKKYYEEHKQELKQKHKIWIEKNRETYLGKKKQYHLEHKEEEREKRKKYIEKNKDKIRETNKLRMRKIRAENKEKFRQYNREYRQKNKNKIRKREIEYQETRNARQKERMENDIIFKFKRQTRDVIRQSFKRGKYIKEEKTEKIIGCTYMQFIEHLLKTFKNNYGYEWNKKEQVHIDHIIPLSTAKSKEEIIKLCHYTNLQLLKAKDNLRKSNRLDFDIKEIERE